MDEKPVCSMKNLARSFGCAKAKKGIIHECYFGFLYFLMLDFVLISFRKSLEEQCSYNFLITIEDIDTQNII